MKLLFLVLLVFNSIILVAQNDTIILPSPVKTGGMPLMEALSKRSTNRDFIDKEFTYQQISNILWAANGINRPELDKRTAPSAMNRQETNIYLINKNGIYIYDANNNLLVLKNSGDYRASMGKQEFVSNASVILMYVADFEKFGKASSKTKEFFSSANVGFISQNVYLYCASERLNTVVYGYMDKKVVSKLLALNQKQRIILGQCIGFPKN